MTYTSTWQSIILPLLLIASISIQSFNALAMVQGDSNQNSDTASTDTDDESTEKAFKGKSPTQPTTLITQANNKIHLYFHPLEKLRKKNQEIAIVNKRLTQPFFYNAVLHHSPHGFEPCDERLISDLFTPIDEHTFEYHLTYRQRERHSYALPKPTILCKIRVDLNSGEMSIYYHKDFKYFLPSSYNYFVSALENNADKMDVYKNDLLQIIFTREDSTGPNNGFKQQILEDQKSHLISSNDPDALKLKKTITLSFINEKIKTANIENILLLIDNPTFLYISLSLFNFDTLNNELTNGDINPVVVASSLSIGTHTDSIMRKEPAIFTNSPVSNKLLIGKYLDNFVKDLSRKDNKPLQDMPLISTSMSTGPVNQLLFEKLKPYLDTQENLSDESIREISILTAIKYLNHYPEYKKKYREAIEENEYSEPHITEESYSNILFKFIEGESSSLATKVTELFSELEMHTNSNGHYNIYSEIQNYLKSQEENIEKTLSPHYEKSIPIELVDNSPYPDYYQPLTGKLQLETFKPSDVDIEQNIELARFAIAQLQQAVDDSLDPSSLHLLLAEGGENSIAAKFASLGKEHIDAFHFLIEQGRKEEIDTLWQALRMRSALVAANYRQLDLAIQADIWDLTFFILELANNNIINRLAYADTVQSFSSSMDSASHAVKDLSSQAALQTLLEALEIIKGFKIRSGTAPILIGIKYLTQYYYFAKTAAIASNAAFIAGNQLSAITAIAKLSMTGFAMDLTYKGSGTKRVIDLLRWFDPVWPIQRALADRINQLIDSGLSGTETQNQVKVLFFTMLQLDLNNKQWRDALQPALDLLKDHEPEDQLESWKKQALTPFSFREVREKYHALIVGIVDYAQVLQPYAVIHSVNMVTRLLDKGTGRTIHAALKHPKYQPYAKGFRSVIRGNVMGIPTTLAMAAGADMVYGFPVTRSAVNAVFKGVGNLASLVIALSYYISHHSGASNTTVEYYKKWKDDLAGYGGSSTLQDSEENTLSASNNSYFSYVKNSMSTLPRLMIKNIKEGFFSLFTYYQ